jgi:hypothetical protein
MCESIAVQTFPMVTTYAKTNSNEFRNNIAIRVMTTLLDGISKQKNPNSLRYDLLHYLTRPNDKIPQSLQNIEGFLMNFEQIPSFERLREYFQNLEPETSSWIINSLLTKPSGLYEDAQWREKLLNRAVEGCGEYKNQAKLLLEALLHALHKKAPFQESITLAYILSQQGKSDLSAAEQFANLITRIGNSGVSIGQKLYQRRMVPDEFLVELENLTHNARPPLRIDMYNRVAQILGVDDVDEILSIEESLGDASSKFVVRVKYKNKKGVTQQAELPSSALKIMWQDFNVRNQIEKDKLHEMQRYLEEHGGSEWKKLRPLLRSVSRGLDLQSDPRNEKNFYEGVRSLYETNKLSKNGTKFVVVPHQDMYSESIEHVHQEIADGISLGEIKDNNLRRKVFEDIALKDLDILFTNENTQDGYIYFERDRHKGNYRYNEQRSEAQLLDYAQLSRISVARREEFLKFLSFVELYQRLPSRREDFLSQIVKIVTQHLSENDDQVILANPINPEARELMVKDKIRNYLNSTALKKGNSVSTGIKAFQIFGIIEEVGLRIHDEVDDFATALGNTEYFVSQSSLAQEKMRKGVQRIVKDEISSQLRARDKIKLKCDDWLKAFLSFHK